jgi:hypothetical protein
MHLLPLYLVCYIANTIPPRWFYGSLFSLYFDAGAFPTLASGAYSGSDSTVALTLRWRPRSLAPYEPILAVSALELTFRWHLAVTSVLGMH